MKASARRVAQLEQRVEPPGRVIVVGASGPWGSGWDWTAEERSAAIERAHQKAGPNDVVIVIEWTHGWRCPEMDADE